jgi:hypothetical protein
MVAASDYIVRAVVKSVTPEWRENPGKPGQRYIASRVELDIKEAIKGAPPQPLVLDFVGGKIGDKELIVDGAPKLEVGQESILFVRGNGRLVVPLVGMHHGHYPVRRDARTGQDQMLRSSGKLLYSEKEVSLPESAASSVAPGAKPLSSSDFAARIRQSPKFSQRERLE